MAIPPELQAQILRLALVEKWPVGTIARHLHVHYATVSRVLNRGGLPQILERARHSIADPYVPFIRETLDKYPDLTASRLHVMACERGYTGGQSHFRYIVSLHRSRKPAQAYLRLRTLAGEQAQVDWGHFGHMTIGRARRPLMAFVMVLSYSRAIFLRFFLDARIDNFLRGHVAAFDAFGGVPRVLLYDNLRSVVLERQGDAIRFNPGFLEFAAHYHFEPRPVAVARGNEKGRVERAIQYCRTSFWPARDYSDLDDLNAQAKAWGEGQAANRPCPEDNARTVREVHAEEADRLLKLPDNPFPVIERKEVSVGKTPYVRFDLNDYSVPYTHAQRKVTVLAETDRVRIVCGQDVLASHPRSYGKGEQIEQPDHIKDLVERKRQARRHRATDRLVQAAPASRDLLVHAAERGDNIGAITAALIKLLDRYGSSELQTAIGEALSREVPHHNAVRQILGRRRDENGQSPPVALILPAHVQARDKPVKTTRLDVYDRITGNKANGND